VSLEQAGSSSHGCRSVSATPPRAASLEQTPTECSPVIGHRSAAPPAARAASAQRPERKRLQRSKEISDPAVMTILPPVDPGKEALYKHSIVQVTFYF